MKNFSHHGLILIFLISFNLFSKQQRFVIDICSYNNKQWFKKNLDSVISQIDEDYHIFYTDDCSTDGTYDLVKKYIDDRNLNDKITLVRNDSRRKQLANHYRVIHWCKPDDIIVVLDGDDAFFNKWVLSKLRRVYKNPDIWMTYGQFKNWPQGKRGYCKKTDQAIIDSGKFRSQNWIWGHLRSYRAWLAKEIKLEDLIISEVKSLKEIAPYNVINKNVIYEIPRYQGKFFPASADCALGYPMVELARNHIKFIRKILYLRNIANTINTFKTQFDVQQYCAQYVRSSKNYYPALLLPHIDIKSVYKDAKADVILFLEKSVSSARQFLDSVYHYIKDVGNIFVFYKHETQELIDLKEQFSSLFFIKIDDNDSLQLCEDIVKKSPQNYFFVSDGSCLITRKICLSTCLNLLESTKAYAYNFKLNLACPPKYFDFTGMNDCYFMQYQLNPPIDNSLILCRKMDLLKMLSMSKCEKNSNFVISKPVDSKNISLFFGQAYVKNQAEVEV